jgi:hypothetical protein
MIIARRLIEAQEVPRTPSAGRSARLGLGGSVDYLVDSVFKYATLAESRKVAERSTRRTSSRRSSVSWADAVESCRGFHRPDAGR